MSIKSRYGAIKKYRDTKEYRAWSNMKTRCNNPNYYLYPRYGGRGISVCDRWSDFLCFLEDMGLAPSKKHSLDRIDGDGNYCPENCRWATPEEQANNMSNNKIVDINGIKKTLADWCREYGRDYSMCARRIDLGWSPKAALESEKGVKTYKYVTPDGEFESQYEVADYYGIKLKTVSARFCSKTMKSWVKVKILP